MLPIATPNINQPHHVQKKWTGVGANGGLLAIVLPVVYSERKDGYVPEVRELWYRLEYAIILGNIPKCLCSLWHCNSIWYFSDPKPEAFTAKGLTKNSRHAMTNSVLTFPD